MLHKRVLEQLNRFCQKKKKKTRTEDPCETPNKNNPENEGGFCKIFSRIGFFSHKNLIYSAVKFKSFQEN